MVNVKRYWILAHDTYYPKSNLDNVIAWFDTYDEALEFINQEIDEYMDGKTKPLGEMFDNCVIKDMQGFQPEEDYRVARYLSSKS